MKKIYRFFFAAVAIASAAACAEQIENDQVPGGQAGPADFAQMTISASLGEVTKTTYDNQNVLWEGTESITVFSKGSENTPTEFAMNWCAEDKTEAAFSGLADLNADAYYAVYPHSATNACTAEGVLTVKIPAEQTAVAGGFASGANVSVAAWQKSALESEENVIFNNVCTLLSFGFETDADAILTQSVTVKMKSETGYINIAGNVSVNYNPEGDLVVSEGTTDSIVLTAPTGGFVKGQTYYVLVAPVGQIAEMELTYTHTDGTTTCTRKNRNIVASLSRSALVPLETIPVAYDDLPQKDFEVVVDFSSYPFNEPIELEQTASWAETPIAEKIHTFKKYTFQNEYTINGVKVDRTFGIELAVGKDITGYKYEDGVLKFYYDGTKTTVAAYGGFITCPLVENRYLSKVKLEYDGEVMFRIHSEPYWTGTNFNKTANDSCEFQFPAISGTKVINSELNHGYSVGTRTRNVSITKITFTYSKTKPE